MISTPTPEQNLAANPNTHAWVSACAGAGKTSILINRVARLLLAGVKPQSIICLTYTKAAANEIAQRLFDRLGTWCVLDDNSLNSTLADLGADSGQNTELARGLFADALETPGGLRIQTIHSFCATLLRRFPLEAGIPHRFVEIDDIQQRKLRYHALNAALRQTHTDPALDAAMREVVLTAGGSKLLDTVSDVCTHRASFARRLAHADAFDNILDELHALCPPSESVETLCDRFMQTALPRPDLETLLTPLLQSNAPTDHKLAELVQMALDSRIPTKERFLEYRNIAFDKSGKIRKSNPYTKKPPCQDSLEKLFSVKTSHGSEIQRIIETDNLIGNRICYEQSLALITVCAKVLKHYKDEKKKRGWLDFDDLIQNCLDLFKQSHAAQWVRWKLDDSICHILIDEAQDTSPEQWNMLDTLSSEIFAGHSQDNQIQRTMFVVGDQRQSIYSFHGAVPADFPKQKKNFIRRCNNAKSDPKIITLNTSFRSAPEILRFVDAVSNQMPEQQNPQNLQTESEQPIEHKPHRCSAQGRVELWLPQKPDPHSNTPAKTDLAERIATGVKNALERGEPVGDDQKPLNPGDIMVLVRGRTDGLFVALHRAFRQLGLPVVGADRIKLTDSPAVQDCLNLIRFALCPQDDLVLAELLTSPFCNLDHDKHLFPLSCNRGKRSVWSQLRNSSELSPTTDFLKRVLSLAHRPPFEFLSCILDHPMLADNKTGRDALFNRFGAPELNPVDALLDTALDTEHPHNSSLQRFVCYLEQLDTDIQTDMNTPAQIRIMTIHAAKGSEAPMVILPDCSAELSRSRTGILYSEQNLPVWPKNLNHNCQIADTLNETDKAARLEDSHRLLYVAMTRARDLLVITGPHHGNRKSGYDKESWMELCHNAMNTLCENGYARKISDTHFISGRDPQQAGPEVATVSEQLPELPDWMTSAAPQPTPTLDRRRPSTRQNHSRDSKTQQRGILIHDLLDLLHNIEPQNRLAAAKKHILNHDMPDHDKNEAIQTALKVLNDPECSKIYTESGLSEVPIAGKLTSPSGQTISVNGRMDRLIISDDSILIVEIKTDRPAPQNPEQANQHYLTQLATYAALLGKAHPSYSIRTAFLWTDGPKLMMVDTNLPTDPPERTNTQLA